MASKRGTLKLSLLLLALVFSISAGNVLQAPVDSGEESKDDKDDPDVKVPDSPQVDEVMVDPMVDPPEGENPDMNGNGAEPIEDNNCCHSALEGISSCCNIPKLLPEPSENQCSHFMNVIQPMYGYPPPLPPGMNPDMYQNTGIVPEMMMPAVQPVSDFDKMEAQMSAGNPNMDLMNKPDGTNVKYGNTLEKPLGVPVKYDNSMVRPLGKPIGTDDFMVKPGGMPTKYDTSMMRPVLMADGSMMQPAVMPAIAADSIKQPGSVPSKADDPRMQVAVMPARADDSMMKPAVMPARADDSMMKPAVMPARADDSMMKPAVMPARADDSMMKPAVMPARADDSMMRPVDAVRGKRDTAETTMSVGVVYVSKPPSVGAAATGIAPGSASVSPAERSTGSVSSKPGSEGDIKMTPDGTPISTILGMKPFSPPPDREMKNPFPMPYPPDMINPPYPIAMPMPVGGLKMPSLPRGDMSLPGMPQGQPSDMPYPPDMLNPPSLIAMPMVGENMPPTSGGAMPVMPPEMIPGVYGRPQVLPPYDMPRPRPYYPYNGGGAMVNSFGEGCYMDCIFSQNNLTNADGDLVYDAVKQHFTQNISDEWMPHMKAAILECNRSASDAAKELSTSQLPCKPTARFFINCMQRMLFMKCPNATAKKDDEYCISKTRDVNKCNPFSVPKSMPPPPMMAYGPPMAMSAMDGMAMAMGGAAVGGMAAGMNRRTPGEGNLMNRNKISGNVAENSKFSNVQDLKPNNKVNDGKKKKMNVPAKNNKNNQNKKRPQNGFRNVKNVAKKPAGKKSNNQQQKTKPQQQQQQKKKPATNGNNQKQGARTQSANKNKKSGKMNSQLHKGGQKEQKNQKNKKKN